MSRHRQMVTTTDEQDARSTAKRMEHEGFEVSIIADQEKFYVETPPSGLIRTFERLVYMTKR